MAAAGLADCCVWIAIHNPENNTSTSLNLVEPHQGKRTLCIILAPDGNCSQQIKQCQAMAESYIGTTHPPNTVRTCLLLHCKTTETIFVTVISDQYVSVELQKYYKKNKTRMIYAGKYLLYFIVNNPYT
jgi:hypothetical protein